jgi:hypothetical protein
MAKRTVLVDDFDESPADETVGFALDGDSYAIDLTAEHAAQLREALAPYIGHARRVTGRSAARPARTRQSAADIRAWAQEAGVEVSSRGRIPADVVAAYEAAQA